MAVVGIPRPVPGAQGLDRPAVGQGVNRLLRRGRYSMTDLAKALGVALNIHVTPAWDNGA